MCRRLLIGDIKGIRKSNNLSDTVAVSYAYLAPAVVPKESKPMPGLKAFLGNLQSGFYSVSRSPPDLCMAVKTDKSNGLTQARFSFKDSETDNT